MKKFILLIVFIFICIFCWFFIEPELITVHKYKIHNPELKNLSVVFTADFHVYKRQHKRLAKTVEKINAQKPDIVLLGGDFVRTDSPEKSMDIETIAQYLGQIKPKYLTAAVLGNHDYAYSVPLVIKALSQNNIKVLMNENVSVNSDNKKIFVAGVEDAWWGEPDIDKALKNAKKPIILLSHNPDLFPEIPSHVDLTLCGHTHGGQVVLPILGIMGTKFVPLKHGNKYVRGFIEEDNKKMIVTNGLGTSIFPVRFNAFPEIVVIDFY